MNLSAKILSSDQLFVLSRGFSFAPTCHFNLFNVIIQQFNNLKDDEDLSFTNDYVYSFICTSFSEQFSVCNLQHLQAQSGVDGDISMSYNYDTKKPFLSSLIQFSSYRTFQEMEEEMCLLPQKSSHSDIYTHYNLILKQRKALKTMN